MVTFVLFFWLKFKEQLAKVIFTVNQYASCLAHNETLEYLIKTSYH